MAPLDMNFSTAVVLLILAVLVALADGERAVSAIHDAFDL